MTGFLVIELSPVTSLRPLCCRDWLLPRAPPERARGPQEWWIFLPHGTRGMDSSRIHKCTDLSVCTHPQAALPPPQSPKDMTSPQLRC